MVNYNCQQCGYNTIRKSVFKNHLLRKKLCKPILKEYTQYDLLVLNGFKEDAKLYKKSTKVSQKSADSQSKVSQNGLLNCAHCNKLYKHKQSKWKHEQKCNKNENKLLKKLLEEKDKLILVLFEEMKKDKDEMKKNKKENKKLLKQLIKLSNNGTNINNNNINSHNKIIINAYGCENIEYVTEKILKRLVSKPGSAIPNLLKMIHFNDKYPENKNLKVTNIHDPYIKVHNGDDWKIKSKCDIIEDIITSKRDMLDGAVVDEDNDEFYVEKLEKIDKSINDKTDNFIEKSVKDVLFNI